MENEDVKESSEGVIDHLEKKVELCCRIIKQQQELIFTMRELTEFENNRRTSQQRYYTRNHPRNPRSRDIRTTTSASPVRQHHHRQHSSREKKEEKKVVVIEDSIQDTTKELKKASTTESSSRVLKSPSVINDHSIHEGLKRPSTESSRVIKRPLPESRVIKRKESPVVVMSSNNIEKKPTQEIKIEPRMDYLNEILTPPPSRRQAAAVQEPMGGYNTSYDMINRQDSTTSELMTPPIAVKKSVQKKKENITASHGTKLSTGEGTKLSTTGGTKLGSSGGTKLSSSGGTGSKLSSTTYQRPFQRRPVDDFIGSSPPTRQFQKSNKRRLCLLQPNVNEPQVQYREVVRKKAERENMPAYDCEECAAYYATLEGIIKPEYSGACSRHRSRCPPVESPDDFWNLSLPSPRR